MTWLLFLKYKYLNLTHNKQDSSAEKWLEMLHNSQQWGDVIIDQPRFAPLQGAILNASVFSEIDSHTPGILNISPPRDIPSFARQLRGSDAIGIPEHEIKAILLNTTVGEKTREHLEAWVQCLNSVNEYPRNLPQVEKDKKERNDEGKSTPLVETGATGREGCEAYDLCQ